MQSRWNLSRAGTRFDAWPLLVALAMGCGSDEGVTYSKDVGPLLERRCAICHTSENKFGIIDMQDPFTQDDPPGLVGSVNVWSEGHPVAKYNVVPGDPDNSFIMQKITDPNLHPGCDYTAPGCDWDVAGFFMPPAPAHLPGERIDAVYKWIADGADDTDFYRSEVFPIFGDPNHIDGNMCALAKLEQGCIPCIVCHNRNSLYSPDLTQPFDPVVGVVGVRARFRTDLLIVKPGDPENSLLWQKLHATEPSSAIGAPMPYGFPHLSTTEVDLLRQWIVAGATDN
jgi:hypothetical protein